MNAFVNIVVHNSFILRHTFPLHSEQC
jgi:hypothetical protein